METLGELIEYNARYYPHKEAYIYKDRRITHAQYAVRSRKLASALHQAGMRHQDRVAILAMNCLEYFDVFGAGDIAGYIVTTVNFRLAPPEIAFVLQDSQPRVLVFEAQYAAVVDSLRGRFPDIAAFVCIGPAPDWAIEFDSFLESGSEEGPPFRSSGSDIAALVYTSGTTGRPKGVIRTQSDSCYMGEECAQDTGFGPHSRYLALTPCFHTGVRGYQAAVMWRAATLVLHREFDPVKVLDTIQAEKITFMFVVATMLQAILDVPGVQDCDLSSMDSIVTAGAPVPVPLLQRAFALLGPIFSVQYGSTETNGTVLHRNEVNPNGSPEDLRRLASVGHVGPRNEIRIVDDHDVDLPAGKPGEVLIKTRSMIRGYWNNTPATIDALRGGWFHTGDMGYLDEEGYLYLVDRKKDMIISGGENIYSKEVEDALIRHPALADVAVIGVADAKWGESVKAVAVLKKGATLAEQELIVFAKTQIASYKCPKSVAFVDELPRVPSGKVNKVALRERYRN